MEPTKRSIPIRLAAGVLAAVVMGCSGGDREETTNLAPIARDDLFSVVQDTRLVLDVLANDSDPDGDNLHLDAFTLPADGLLERHPEGGLVYSTPADADRRYAFVYHVADGRGGRASAEVTLVVAPPLVCISASEHLGSSAAPAFTADCDHRAHRIVFSSRADDLVPADANGRADVFLYDIRRGDLTCISRTPAGATGNGSSLWPRISADGSRVAFHSFASDLVEGDDNACADVFLYDTVTGRLECVSRAADGPSAFAALDAAGDWVAFVSSATDLAPGDGCAHAQVYLFDRARGSIERISRAPGGEPANGASGFAEVGAGGRHIVFQSAADNLVPRDTNDLVDVFWHDRQTGVTHCLSRGLDDAPADGASAFQAISADGTRAAFQSRAANLVEGDTNGASDIFVVALTASARPRRVSLSADGAQADADSSRPALDAAGRRLVFVSRATNLTADAADGRPDVFATPLDAAAPFCMSRGRDGQAAADASLAPRLAGDGRFAVFESRAVNLVGAASQHGIGVLRAAWVDSD